jgi:transposase
MVLLSDRAYSAPQIATIHDCGQDVMRLWLHRYDTEGRAGLDDESRSGLPRKDGDPLDLRNLQDQPPLDNNNLFIKNKVVD